jgi:hypothetical protein
LLLFSIFPVVQQLFTATQTIRFYFKHPIKCGGHDWTGRKKGNTPLLIDLSRKDHHTVKITLDGFLPYETRLVRKVDGWIAGNIVFGGLIGLAVDAISGGMYKLTPDQLQAEMRSGANASIDKSSGLYLTVVLNPQKNWQKIGQLERLN